MNRYPEPRDPNPDDALIQRFVDGALDARERVRVEALLASDGDAFETAMAYQRQNVLMQALHARREDDTLLPPVALGLSRRVRRVRLAQRAAALSVAMVALVGTGTIGWQTHSYVRSLQPTPVVAVFPQSMASTARRDLAPTPAALRPAVESSRSDGSTVIGSGSGRVAVHPPNLQTIGYQLVDGRADLTAYGPVIRFSYEPIDGKGSRLALTVAAFGDDRQSLATSINPQHTSLFWQDGQLLFALSGTTDPSRLVRVADAVNAERSKAAAASADTASDTGNVAPALETPAVDEQTPASKTEEAPKET